MVDLITSSLSQALLAADSSVKLASKPMNMVLRETKKGEPNLELIDRVGKYETKELGKVEKSLNQAQEELKKAQKTARQEEKAENKAVSSENVVNEENVTTENPDGAISSGGKVDTVEISAEGLNQPPIQNVVVDTPKVYTSNSTAVSLDAAAPSQVNVKI